MEEMTPERYSEALHNLYESKSDLWFANDKVHLQVLVFQTVLGGTKDEVIMSCNSLNDSMFHNELFIASLKKCLQKGNVVTFIVNEEIMSEELLKLYKAHVSNFLVYKINDELLNFLRNSIKEGNEYKTAFVSGKSYIMQFNVVENNSQRILACYKDSQQSKFYNKAFKKYLPKLQKIDFLVEKKMPSVDEVLYKFRGVDIDEKILRDIVEFSQGKNK